MAKQNTTLNFFLTIKQGTLKPEPPAVLTLIEIIGLIRLVHSPSLNV